MVDQVRAACEANYTANTNNCSGFVTAVAASLKIQLTGMADDIVTTIRSSDDWTSLVDGAAAAVAAAAGQLVVAGMKGGEQTTPNAHGHVVVVVSGPLDAAHGKYPHAYWGSLGGNPGHDQTLNFAWVASDRDRITYATCALP